MLFFGGRREDRFGCILPERSKTEPNIIPGFRADDQSNSRSGIGAGVRFGYSEHLEFLGRAHHRGPIDFWNADRVPELDVFQSSAQGDRARQVE